MIIDAHVHLVGNGSSGSGCRLNLRGTAHLGARLLLRSMRLPAQTLRGDLDRAYSERLGELAEQSSLDAVAVFAQDDPYEENGQRMTGRGTFYVPNEYLFAVCARHRKFLPVCSIHPARVDALEELERCLAAGAVALKLLPNAHNVDTRLPRYRRFWERMAEAGLPLIAHTGGENTIDEVDAHLADPRTLTGALEAGVTVIAAHCATKSGAFDPEYFFEWAKMLTKYPRLYGDNSAFLIPNRCWRLRACTREPVAARVLHGSDVPVPVFVHPAVLTGAIGLRDFWRLRRIANPLERDFQVKRAAGFAPEVFTRASEILRIAAWRKRG